MVYKSLIGKKPSYLRNLLQVKPQDRFYLRSQNQQLLVVPRISSKTFGDRAFLKAGLKLWNSLPEDIKEIQSIEIIKKPLKTYLFKLAYDGNVPLFFKYLLVFILTLDSLLFMKRDFAFNLIITVPAFV